MSAGAHNDAELVSESLSGNRDAFGRIVADIALDKMERTHVRCYEVHGKGRGEGRRQP